MRNFNFKMPAIFREWKMNTQSGRRLRQVCIFIFLMSSAKLFAQNVVTGKVTDENKEALIGVNVHVKGTSSGAMTDMDGKYSISVPNGGAVLVFSFVGFERQEVPVRNQSVLDVVLKAGESVLSEVVVVGYGTQTKANLTGAVSTINSDVLESRPITNLAQGLQGMVPNLNINVNSGAPGRGATFNIRGQTNLNNSAGPLVLVDGVVMDPNLVNPADVASVTVLKDASSAAIYGVRGAYGVILITTKNPKSRNGKVAVNYTGSYTVSRDTRLPKYVSGVDYIRMHREADATGARSGGDAATDKFTDLDYANAQKYNDDPVNNLPLYPDPANPSRYRYVGNTDWIKELYPGWAPMRDHNLSIAGGEGKTSFGINLGHLNQDGILKVADDNFKRYNVSLRMSSDVKSWLNINAKMTLNRTQNDKPTSASHGGLAESWIAGDLRPIMPVRHPDGNFSGQGNFTNTVALATLNGRTLDTVNDLWMTGGVVLTPLPGLRVVTDYTWNGYARNVTAHTKEYQEFGVNGTLLGTFPWSTPSRVTETDYSDYYTALNAYAEYSKTLSSVHNFKALLGYNQELKQTKTFNASAKNLIDQTKPAINLNNDQAPTVGGGMGEWAVSGTFFRLNYDYKGRYLVEANGRYDGTSRFPRDNRYVFLPSVSVGWRLSDEAFFSPLQRVFSDLKIRASYGTLGNQSGESLGNYPYLATMGTGAVNYIMGSQRGLTVTAPGLVSANFTWEKVTSKNIGVDFGFLKNRLIGSFDWYTRDTRDMIVGAVPLPSVLGTNPPNRNAADLRTKGWELSSTWRDRVGKDWSYDITLALSDYQAKITKFDLNPNKTIGSRYEGENLNEIWGYVTDRYFTSDEEAKNFDQSRLFGGTWLAGDIKYTDLNNDGKINPGANTVDDAGDRKVIGNSTPRYQYGVVLGVSYKNLDFNVVVQGVGKRDVAVGGREFWGFVNEWNVPLEHQTDYWTAENTDAYYPRLRFGGGGNFNTQTRYLQNAAYARLKNISLGYTLPRQWVNKIGLENLRIYVTGQNLMELTKFYKALDPETVGQSVYPLSRSVSSGIQIGL